MTRLLSFRPVAALRERDLLGLVIIAVIGLLASFVLADPFQQHLLALVFLWTLAGQSWNISYGYAGQLSFGHSVFVGIGAYALALLLHWFGLSPYIDILVGMVAAAVVAIAIGFPTFRLTGAYFALATIVMPLIAIVIVDSLGQQELTLPFTGAQGAAYMIFADPRGYSVLALIAMLISLLVVRWLDRSRSAYMLRALRENEVLAESVGVDTVRWKLIAFALSAAMAAAFGVVWVETALLVVASDDVFSLAIVIQMISICLVGGLGNRWGPVIGAAILVPLSEELNAQFGARIPGIQILAYGVVLMIVILVAPDGVYSLLARLARRLWLAPVVGETISPAVSVLHRHPAVGTVLRLDRVSKSFGGLVALQDISLAVERAQVVGIIGPNGAGKTTLLNLISGIYRPDTGRLHFEGEDVTSRPPHRRCRLGLARTFQTPHLLQRISVGDNVVVAAFACTTRVADARSVAAQALNTVGLPGSMDRRTSTLSTFEIKLVEIARAIASCPSLLLMDESMSGLNREEHKGVIALVRRLQDDGLTIIMIEHAIGSLLEVADKLIVLQEGKLLAEGAGEEVMANPSVVEAYLGRRWTRDAKGPGPVGQL